MSSPTYEQDWLDRTIVWFKRRPLVWIPSLIIIVIVAVIIFQHLYTTDPIGTDPTVAGRPLSNPDQHLHSMEVSPTEPGIIYLGSHYGLFTSNDDGKHWPQARGALNTLMITSISTSQVATGTLGTIGIAPTGGDFGNNGIYITHDQGKSWYRAGDPQGVPSDTSRYLIDALPSSQQDWLAIYVGFGLYVTHDDGKDWQLLRAPVSDKDAQRSLWTSPSAPHTILLGSNLGLWRSTDDGTSWKQIDEITGGVNALVSSQVNPDRVYLTGDQGLFVSTDAGAHFSLVSSPVASAPFSRLAISQQDSDLLYGLVGSQIWRSTDGGHDWTMQSSLPTSYPMALLIAPDNGQHIYVGFYQPAIASESLDGGKTWTTIAS
jgi:photosystem II stability/assembly factor-like uncharacterized protein